MKTAVAPRVTARSNIIESMLKRFVNLRIVGSINIITVALLITSDKKIEIAILMKNIANTVSLPGEGLKENL